MVIHHKFITWNFILLQCDISIISTIFFSHLLYCMTDVSWFMSLLQSNFSKFQKLSRDRLVSEQSGFRSYRLCLMCHDPIFKISFSSLNPSCGRYLFLSLEPSFLSILFLFSFPFIFFHFLLFFFFFFFITP